MIQLRSVLEVADNTGARKAALIQRMGQQTAYAHVGDIVTVHIKESTTDANVKKGEVALFRAVRKGEQVRVIDEKGKEKTIDLKDYGVMTRGSVGLKAVKAVRFA